MRITVNSFIKGIVYTLPGTLMNTDSGQDEIGLVQSAYELKPILRLVCWKKNERIAFSFFKIILGVSFSMQV